MADHKKIRPRSKYHNKKSYDDQLAIVRELLAQAEGVEYQIVAELEQVLRDLYNLYTEQFPFYFPSGILNQRQYERLVASLHGQGATLFSEFLDRAKRDVDRLQNERLMAWLRLDYELTARKTAQSIGRKAVWRLPADERARVLQPWCKDKKDFSARIKINTEDMDAKFRATLIKGIRQGWSPRQMAQYFKDIAGIAAYKSQRLIRTETMAVFAKATKDTFLQNGIKYVQIVGDAACGGICLDYVGQYLTLEEAQIGDELPPYHPNCACSFCAYEEFDEKNMDNDV